MTLTELLVAISILLIISSVLTEAVILGLKTTDRTAVDIARSIATHNLSSYFSADAQSADTVAVSGPKCAAEGDSVAYLSWTDGADKKVVNYTLKSSDDNEVPPRPATRGDLIRSYCVNATVARQQTIGTFSHIVGVAPVALECEPSDCSVAREVTLVVQPPSPGNEPSPERLKVKRRVVA